MREILFRGKRCNNGEWAEGCLIRDEFCNTDIPYIGYLSDYDIGAVEVTPETVGQFTGLTDENGKKIFEGDIVKLKDGNTCVVRYGRHDLWCCGCCFDSHESVGFYLDEGDGSAYSDDNAWGLVEVIGNIHDQPELVMPPKGE